MDFMDRTIPSWVLRGCEWFFALLGAAVCVVVAIAFASQQFNDLWLTPGLYFLEIIFLALLVLISKVAEVKPVKMSNSVITWIAGGVLLAFVILWGFSMGLFLVPAMLSFWLAAAAGDMRQNYPILPHLRLALVAAIIQAGLIGIFLLLSSISIG